MANFVVSDVHGNYGSLWQLLAQEGLVDENEQRTELSKQHKVYQLGDLLNAVLEDVHGDEEVARVAPEWFDNVLVGNHEAPYLGMSRFNGYWEAPHLKYLYRSWMFNGFLQPALVFGNTLVTHAGVAKLLHLPGETAQEAYETLMATWENQSSHEFDRFFDAIGPRRGGRWTCGGVLWSDKDEPKVKTYSQVVGHTPDPANHPYMHVRKTGNFTLYLDSGCKGGGVPSGVWLDNDGNVMKVVKMGVEEYNLPTPGFAAP